MTWRLGTPALTDLSASALDISRVYSLIPAPKVILMSLHSFTQKLPLVSLVIYKVKYKILTRDYKRPLRSGP